MRADLIAATLATTLAFAAAARGGDQPMLSEPAPTFSLESLDHGRVSLEDFRGKTVVMHFGTGW